MKSTSCPWGCTCCCASGWTFFGLPGRLGAVLPLGAGSATLAAPVLPGLLDPGLGDLGDLGDVLRFFLGVLTLLLPFFTTLCPHTLNDWSNIQLSHGQTARDGLVLRQH